ncbi:hypothetical protein D3C81_1407620 [compost metagenome]
MQRFQLLQHGDDTRFVIGLEDIVKGLDFECFHRMLFIGGDKHNRRTVCEFADVLRQQYPVQRRDIDIEKNGVNLMGLQVFQHVQPVLKGGFDNDIAVFFNQVTEFFLREELVFNDDGFHDSSPAGSMLFSTGSLPPFLLM